jgi:hypothetical protein
MLCVSAVAEESINLISSPSVAELGKVAVTAPLVVLIKYPSPATALKLAVFSACQDVPPTPVGNETVALDAFKVEPDAKVSVALAGTVIVSLASPI